MNEISYICSCYNSAEFLDGLIDNLQGQSNRDWELIVVDSASTDCSVKIVEGWMEDDDRIHLIEQPERTPYGVSWLTGWLQADGDIVCNTNSDDRSYAWRGTQVLMYRDQMRELDERLGRDPKHFYYGGYETRVDNARIAAGHPPPYTEEDLQRFFRCGIHVHWDNDLRHKVDWGVMMKAGYEYKSAFDYWLVLYFMSLGATGVAIPSCFSIYNQRPDSLEQSDKELSSFEGMRAIRTFYPRGPVDHDLETKTRVDSPEYYRRFKEFLAKFD